MAKYAEGTEVSVESSKSEIERIINKYGGKMPSFGWRSPTEAIVGFQYQGVLLRYAVVMPTAKDVQPTGRSRTPVERLIQAEWRRRWRVLCIRLKLKFEVVSGDPDLWASEFLPNTLLPDGQTVEKWLAPQLAQAISEGTMPTRFLLTSGQD